MAVKYTEVRIYAGMIGFKYTDTDGTIPVVIITTKSTQFFPDIGET